MLKQIRRRLKQTLWRVTAFSRLIKNRRSYLHSSGWVESIRRGRPSAPDGGEVPWMNFAVIALLDDRLKPDMRLFEYGSGYSTVFYARRVASVVAVEDNAQWLAAIDGRVPPNAELLHCERDVDGDYCRSINARRGPFDVVVVDGRDRVNCVLQSLDRLSAGGVIILDDTGREEYRPALDAAAAAGFRALKLEGIKPGGASKHSTTLLYRSDNCLGI